MPLPLIMAAGAGILSGAQYLLKKQDEKEGASMLANLQSDVMNGPHAGTAYGDSIMMQGQAAQDDSGFFTMGSPQIRNLQQNYTQTLQADRNMQAQMAAAQAQAQRAQANGMTVRGDQITSQLDQDYRADLKQFGSVVQPAFRQAMSALENPNSADSVAALYNFFNIVEPGGRVTENEDGSFSGIGGAGSKVSNWLNQMRGDGLSEETRSQIMSAVWKQYSPQYERAQQQKRQYEEDINYYGQQGLDVRSPIGRQGINWDINQMPPSMAGTGTSPPIPPGFEAVE